MLEELVNRILYRVREQYPHIECPSAMKARIADVRRLDEEISRECIIKDKATGESRECILKSGMFSYTVRILENDGTDAVTYPEIPDVRAWEEYSRGDVVTVVFVGGEVHPIIVGG